MNAFTHSIKREIDTLETFSCHFKGHRANAEFVEAVRDLLEDEPVGCSIRRFDDTEGCKLTVSHDPTYDPQVLVENLHGLATRHGVEQESFFEDEFD